MSILIAFLIINRSAQCVWRSKTERWRKDLSIQPVYVPINNIFCLIWRRIYFKKKTRRKRKALHSDLSGEGLSLTCHQTESFWAEFRESSRELFAIHSGVKRGNKGHFLPHLFYWEEHLYKQLKSELRTVSDFASFFPEWNPIQYTNFSFKQIFPKASQHKDYC